MQKWINLSH